MISYKRELFEKFRNYENIELVEFGYSRIWNEAEKQVNLSKETKQKQSH